MSLRTALTDSEARLVAENPSRAFGFMIRTSGKPASSLPRGMFVLDAPVKVLGGWVANVVGTTGQLSDLCNRMMADGNPVRGHLLLCDGNGQIPVYDLASSQPIVTDRLSVTSPRVGEEGPSEFCLPKPDRECSYC